MCERSIAQSLVTHPTIGMAVCDSDGRIIESNHVFRKLIGYKTTELASLSLEDLCHAGDREQARVRFRKLVAGDILPFTSCLRYRTKSGRLVWGETHFSAPQDGEGAVETFVATVIDVSDQRRRKLHQDGQTTVLERLYRNFSLEEVCEAIVDSIESVEEGLLCSILRFDAKTETLHKVAAPRLPDYYNAAIDGMKIGPEVGSCGAAAYHNHRVVVADILNHPNWQKARRLIERTSLRSCWSQPILDKDGNLLGTFAIYYNEPREPGPFELKLINSASELAALAISHKQQEEQQKKLEKQLLQSQKMEAIGTMAGGIAHEFNNLLSIIISNIDILQVLEKNGLAGVKNVGHIKEASMRAKVLVSQILTFSRQDKPKLTPVILTQAIDNAIGLLRSTIPSTVEILTSGAREPISINADTTKLQQVIINLCTNAVHAMDEKGVLKIAVEKVDFPGQSNPEQSVHQVGPYARLSISDTGAGMDKVILGKIFDPFFSTKMVGQGTGMGLSVVHGIVEQHGGFISVDSSPGKGSTFCVYFPCIKETVKETEVDAVAALPSGSERILFVDDEEAIAFTSKELLEHHGYRVTSATSSREALKTFQVAADQFDLVITDQTMPEMSGYELAGELLAIRPDLPIILCSGFSAKVSETDVRTIGIREFCLKPMDMKKLLSITRKVLDEDNTLVQMGQG